MSADAGDTTSVWSVRLAALAERYGLGNEAQAKLRALAELLVSDPLAPTTIRSPEAVIDDHLADSLVALELDAVAGARRALDIGSGAGLPGLPLAIALPDTDFVLLESASRKVAFLERAVASCGISNAEVAHARAESWRDGLGRMDLVTARAVAPLEVVVEYAAPLLRIDGLLVAWRGRRDPESEDAAARAGALLGLGEPEIRAVKPYEAAEHRHLYLMSKVMETPSGFPRRPGIAAKRPLGGAGPARRAPSDRPRR